MFAGGTGKRFWPASRKQSPKQFLSVIGDKPLIGLKYDYLRLGFNPQDIYLSTGEQYNGEVQNLLPEMPSENFIFEPEMRDNGPAALYAVLYIARHNLDEVISIQWSDHFIKKPEVFVKALVEAEKLVLSEGKAVIMGVPPRFPSPHRGYIKYGKKIKSLDSKTELMLCEFIRFVEKPSAEVAKEYVQSGDYSWNPAYFVATGRQIVEKYKTFAPEMYEEINAIATNNFDDHSKLRYKNVEKIGFDYIFSENLSPDEALVVNVDMGWSDVGEWVALKETLETNNDENVIQGHVVDLGSKDCLIYNYDDTKLISTIDLNGMVVVCTKDVVAIFNKDDNGKLKEYLNKLEDNGLSSYH